ncbi:MAG: response regulator transcription factor [Caldimonas sp.]
MLPLCLIVAADAGRAPAANRELDLLGFKPYAVDTFAAALGLIRQWQFDAVLVDADGFADTLMHSLPQLHERSNAPIVLLWSEADERRQIQGLESGATAIVPKPASAQLVAAKMRRLIDIGHERHDARQSEIRIGSLRLDPRRATASVGDTALALTTGEFELLLLLASRPGEFVHRDSIARALRQPDGGKEKRRSADMHICRIRKKLRDAGASSLRVDTVYGRGYCLRVEAEEDEAFFGSRYPQWCA